MYCKKCGKQISEDSKFCSFCGTTLVQPQSDNKSQQIDNHKISLKIDFYGFKISKKYLGAYLIWFFIQLILLIVFRNPENESNHLWPFNKHSEISDYGFAEFFLYTITPFFVFILINLFKDSLKIKSISYDLSYKKEKWATVFGVCFIVASIITQIILQSIIQSKYDAVYDVYYFDFKTANGILLYVSVIYRIISTFWVVKISNRQNRNAIAWGIFAFFFPSIALIIIGQLKKIKK